MRTPDKNYNLLKKFTKDLGIDLFGVADIGKVKEDFLLSEDTLAKIKSAVCLGLSLSQGVLEDLKEEPTRLYFHHYRTVNALLDQIAL